MEDLFGAMEGGEMLLVVGVVVFVGYYIYTHWPKNLLPPDWQSKLSNAVTNFNQNTVTAGVLGSSGLRMFDVGSGVTPSGNTWSSTGGAVLIVNGVPVGLSDEIGPGSPTPQTAQMLLNLGWSNGDIADFVAMSNTIPVQALQQGGSSDITGGAGIVDLTGALS
jgi:hypothetical protein